MINSWSIKFWGVTVLPVFLGFHMVFLWFYQSFSIFSGPQTSCITGLKDLFELSLQPLQEVQEFFRGLHMLALRDLKICLPSGGNFISLGKSSNWVIFHYHVWSPGICFCWAWALGQNITPLWFAVVVRIVNICDYISQAPGKVMAFPDYDLLISCSFLESKRVISPVLAWIPIFMVYPWSHLWFRCFGWNGAVDFWFDFFEQSIGKHHMIRC